MVLVVVLEASGTGGAAGGAVDGASSCSAPTNEYDWLLYAADEGGDVKFSLCIRD